MRRYIRSAALWIARGLVAFQFLIVGIDFFSSIWFLDELLLMINGILFYIVIWVLKKAEPITAAHTEDDQH